MENWLNKLFNRILRLRLTSRINDTEGSQIELEKCISLLNRIVEEGSRQNTSVNESYFVEMAQIQDAIADIERNIENKRNTGWDPVLIGISKIALLISTFLGFDTAGNLLSAKESPKLLR